MKSKKLLLVAGLVSMMLIALSFDYTTPHLTSTYVENTTSRDWVEDQPIVDSITIQKLSDSLMDGSNAIMRIQYLADTTLPDTINIFYKDSASIAFIDNGHYPDSIAGDYKYAAYIKEDISAFTTKMNALNQYLADSGRVTYFEGHDGIVDTSPRQFDMVSFEAGHEVWFPFKAAKGVTSCNSIKREYSLFITDLAVVENSARTYNVVANNGAGAGNSVGAWTFGQMIKNMVNQASTGATANAFLKSWVSSWVNDQSVNGETVKARQDVRSFLIYPWVIKANPTWVNTFSGASTAAKTANAIQYLFNNPNYWETLWDNTYEPDLLKNAPFKLSAIVNRMDLRDGGAYGLSINSSGETRFIFSLIAPIDGDFTTGTPAHGGVLSAGTVPASAFNSFTLPFGGVDWKGMNVIFEYSNVQTTRCAMQAFAQSWADLSNYTSFSNSYLHDLQNITDQVTGANVAPGRPNGSAIARIRTNERIFFPSLEGGSTAAVRSWENSDWELRQFEIDASSHLLVEVPVTNTPVGAANYAGVNYGLPITFGSLTDDATNNPNALVNDATKSAALVDWLYTTSNRFKVMNSSHNIPLLFPGTSTPMRAGSALMQMDFVHILDIKWTANTTNHPYSSGTYSPSGDYTAERELRHKLSLNTCQGCHGGETKTIFTQVRPVGYNESVDYTTSPPAYEADLSSANSLQLDDRFSQNSGTTGPGNDPNYRQYVGSLGAGSNRYFQYV